jgi:uncharacterized protein (TIGR00288 family)
MDIAIIADGGFLIKQIKTYQKEYIDTKLLADYIYQFLRNEIIDTLKEKIQSPISLYRILYHDCFPFEGEIVNPFSGRRKEESGHPRKKLLHTLGMMEHVNIREGRLAINGWKVQNLPALVSRYRKENVLKMSVDYDFQPNYVQKGVDTNIVLDMMRLSFQKTVQGIVLITSDSDFVPAIRYAKEAGLRLFLMPLGKMISRDLLSEVDALLKASFESGPNTLTEPSANAAPYVMTPKIINAPESRAKKQDPTRVEDDSGDPYPLVELDSEKNAGDGQKKTSNFLGYGYNLLKKRP